MADACSPTRHDIGERLADDRVENQPRARRSKAAAGLAVAAVRRRGIASDKLTQAFAQLLSGGQGSLRSRSATDEPILDDVLSAEVETSAAEADAHCETTPRSILEAMLFFGNRQNEPLNAEPGGQLNAQGVERQAEIDDLVPN